MTGGRDSRYVGDRFNGKTAYLDFQKRQTNKSIKYDNNTGQPRKSILKRNKSSVVKNVCIAEQKNELNLVSKYLSRLKTYTDSSISHSPEKSFAKQVSINTCQKALILAPIQQKTSPKRIGTTLSESNYSDHKDRLKKFNSLYSTQSYRRIRLDDITSYN